MTSSESNAPATRNSWNILPPPATRTDLGFAESYTPSEFERIKRGLIPLEMEDKWFIFFEEPWLYFHRSWTGACIYGVRFERSPVGASSVESWVSRDTVWYKEARVDYDRALLRFLVDAFLLAKHVSFPVPTDVPLNAPRGIYQAAVVGRAYPESPYPVRAGGLSLQSLAARIRAWLSRR
jgi:hypothetical protein